MAASRKTNKQLLLLKPESSFNVDASPTATADAILCSDPNYNIDFVALERDNIQTTFSKDKHASGRKLAKVEFTIEMKSNGKQTGVAADRCQFGRVLKCCGFKEVAHNAASYLGPEVVDDHVNPVSWSSITGSYAGTDPVNLYMEVVLGGASGVATIKVTSDEPGAIADTAAAVVTSGSAFTIGTGLTVTPTFSGSLVAGQAWLVTVLPNCIEYVPTSDETQMSSATIYLYKDGSLHIMTGAFGTMQVDGEVNGYGKAKCSFIGQYYEPTDVSLPTNAVFEVGKPSQIELARLRVDNFAATVSKFSIDLGVKVLPRSDANGADGYNGTYIDDRMVQGGIDPEATLVSDQNWWKKLSAAKAMPLTYRFGTVAGNRIYVRAPATQYTNLTYQSRDRIQTYDAALAFRKSTVGDDEIRFVTC